MNHNARFANMTSCSPKSTYIRYISGLNDFSAAQSKVHQLFVNRSFVINETVCSLQCYIMGPKSFISRIEKEILVFQLKKNSQQDFSKIQISIAS